MAEQHSTAETAEGKARSSGGAQSSNRARGLLSSVLYSRSSLAAVVLAFLFAGAVLWAKGRDPFQRIWFKVKVPGQGKAECIAVVPKDSPKFNVQSPKPSSRRWPVVVYLHDSGGDLIGDGNELRQMAEMGLAAVGMEYERQGEDGGQRTEGRGQTTEGIGRGAGAFDAQFTVLLDYLQRQSWADTNRIAWVGYSLGAQRLLAFALQHPERQPKLLVRLAGGWVPELEQLRVDGSVLSVQSSPTQPSTLNSQPSTVSEPSTLNTQLSTILALHAERDEVFPLADAQRVAACLETNGVPVELRVLPGESHGLGANRLLVFRVIGEQCLTRLKGPDALSHYRSILSWQAQARPLWLFWTPALLWAALCLWLRLPPGRASVPASPILLSPPPLSASDSPGPESGMAHPAARGTPTPLRWWEKGLRWLAAGLAAAALAQTALHLVPPRLPISERTLGIARKHLVAPKARGDFEFLAAKPFWPGKRLKLLLEHVELGNYNRELINWKLDEQMYQQFVLSPEIDPTADGDLNWRRPLWENFYPRIRKEQSPEAAAEIVVRFLRERVTIAEGSDLPAAVAEIWQRQITNARGFEAVYVAAMRSVGVPARLGSPGRAEFWTGVAWQAAPRPLVEGWK